MFITPFLSVKTHEELLQGSMVIWKMIILVYLQLGLEIHGFPFLNRVSNWECSKQKL